MMRGTIVFVAAIFSIIFLGRRYFRHHWTALILVVSGVAIVGASPAMLNKGGDDGNSNLLLGITLVVIAQFFAGGQFISEEKLLGDYYLHPLKVVGWEGFWGCLIYVIALTIMQFIPCNLDSICPHGTLEDTPQAFREMGKNPMIILFSFGIIFSIAFFNGLGVAVTKYANAAQRSTIDTSRTLLVWVFTLSYQAEGVHEDFLWPQLIGFVLLVIGTLVFNEIVIIPFLGFDQSTKKMLEQRRLMTFRNDSEAIEDGLLEQNDSKNQDYLGTSPASYNYQRNYKNVKKHMEESANSGHRDKLQLSGTDTEK
jgi:drug/metabolite transporter (DMT)-like permease